VADLLPLFPLGTVLFPGVPLPLQVFEPRYRELMQDVMAAPQPWSFGVIAIREGHEVGADSVKSLYDVGCTAVVRDVEQVPDGRIALLLRGDRRFRLLDLDRSRPYLQAGVDYVDERSTQISDELATTVRQRFVDYCSGLGAPGAAATLPDDPTDLSYVVAATMMLPLADRQALLESPDTAARLRGEADSLSRELALLRAGTLPVTQPPLPPYSQN
jgi:hypothetical protein